MHTVHSTAHVTPPAPAAFVSIPNIASRLSGAAFITSLPHRPLHIQRLFTLTTVAKLAIVVSAAGWDIAPLMVKRVRVTIPSTIGPPSAAPHITMDLNYSPVCFALPTAPMRIAVSWASAAQTGCHVNASTRRTDYPLSDAVCTTVPMSEIDVTVATAPTAAITGSVRRLEMAAYVMMPSTIGPPSAAPHITMDLNYSPVCFALPTAPMRIAVSWASAAQTGCHVNASTRRTDYPLSDAVCTTTTVPAIQEIANIAATEDIVVQQEMAATATMCYTTGPVSDVPPIMRGVSYRRGGVAIPIQLITTAVGWVDVIRVVLTVSALIRNIVHRWTDATTGIMRWTCQPPSVTTTIKPLLLRKRN